jgi:adiponectin receptor
MGIQKVSKAFNKLDYVGIVFLICGTYYPALFYAFYNQPVRQTLYMGAVTAFGASEYSRLSLHFTLF